VVDNVGDMIVENVGEGTDTVYSNLTSYTLGANLENLILYDTGNINGTGNELNNVVTGNSGNNILDGGLGSDTMVGGIGNDTYEVDNVGDVVVENAGEGVDTVSSNITYTLGANVENLTLSGAANINGVGNDLNNIMTGNQANNILAGGLGADIMTGGQGNDTYVVDNVGDVIVENVSEGTDTVYSNLTSYTLGANLENLILYDTGNINGVGNDLNNVMTGNQANNILAGGLGADTMTGGQGNDTYVVDNVGDVIVENVSEGTDTIYSNLASYTLGSNLENLILYGTGDITGVGNELNNVLTGNSGNNTLNGGLGNDTLYGGAGNDTLEGGLGDDTYIFDAASGNDTVISYEGTNGNGFDTMLFQNIAIAGMAFTKSANDLICTLTQTNEKIDLVNWFSGSNYEVDQFKFSDGTLTSAQIDKKFA
jgi:Ca2+-binding RTX toxin-like protein